MIILINTEKYLINCNVSLLFYIKYLSKRGLSKPENKHLQKNIQLTSHIMIDVEHNL